MKRGVCSLAALCWLVACGSPQPQSGELSFLSYNVHGLPPEITGDDTTGRIEQIGPLLDAFDIVGLQEDFIDENHALLAEASDHQTQRRFAEVVNEERIYGSGLAVFGILEELDYHHVHYETCHGVLDAASDCLASKGFQAVRLRLGEGASVDVYNTHLEAGGSGEDNAARAVHVDQLLDALGGWSAERSVVFLGDTNLHASDPDDAPELERLLGEGGLTDSCEAVSCAEPDHIDRILFRDGEGVRWEAQAWANEPGFDDDEGVDLSDHPPISALLSWSWSPEP